MMANTKKEKTKLLSMKSRFKEPYLGGFKLHTIRQRRKDPINAGDVLKIYADQRSPDNELLGFNVIDSVVPIEIRFILTEKGLTFDYTEYVATPQQQIYFWDNPEGFKRIERLALEDGFESVEEFITFFVETHGAADNVSLSDFDLVVFGEERHQTDPRLAPPENIKAPALGAKNDTENAQHKGESKPPPLKQIAYQIIGPNNANWIAEQKFHSIEHSPKGGGVLVFGGTMETEDGQYPDAWTKNPTHQRPISFGEAFDALAIHYIRAMGLGSQPFIAKHETALTHTEKTIVQGMKTKIVPFKLDLFYLENEISGVRITSLFRPDYYGPKSAKLKIKTPRIGVMPGDPPYPLWEELHVLAQIVVNEAIQWGFYGRTGTDQQSLFGNGAGVSHFEEKRAQLQNILEAAQTKFYCFEQEEPNAINVKNGKKG